MTELGASYSMVYAVTLAMRLFMNVDDVLNLPLAKTIAYQSAIDVIDGKKPAQTTISKEDKEIVKFLSENQEGMIEKLKSMRRF